MNKKKALVLLVNAVIVVLILFFTFILSPYAYEWDETIKQVDYDKLDVLKVIWIFILLSTVLVPIILKPTKKTVYIWYILLVLYSIVKTILLFLIK